MTETSTIPGVLDDLEDLLAGAYAGASVAGTKVQVTQGPPRDPEQERIELADVENAPQEWETLGGLVNRNEQYLITCWVSVADPRHLTFRSCKNRAFELLAITEEALRVEDPLGYVAAQKYAYFELDFGGVVSAKGGPIPDTGWAYEIQFTVRVEATI